SAHSQSQYFPLVYSTLRLEHALWGFNAVGYHLVNVCLHIGNALLVWALLRRLAVTGAWLAAAIFALHPVQVETVAWVTELKNTESTLFYLLALFAWLRFCAGKGGWYYLVALALHMLALFAKTTACTLPAAMLLVLWLTNMPTGWRRLVQVLPFLLLGFGMGLLSVWWEKHLGNYEPKFHLLGGPVDRLLIATHALWFYAGKLLWPSDLTFSYPHWDINASQWPQFGWLVGCLTVAAVLWFGRRKFGRNPAIGIVFFVAALSPMLGFIPLYTFYFSYVADHYQYLACLGIIALVASGLTHWFAYWRAPWGAQATLTGILLCFLGLLTWRQCHIYQNLETLWSDTLQKNPRCWMAHTNLGRLLAQAGNFAEAETHYQAALAVKPDEDNAHYNYGNLLARTGRLDEAINQYRIALEIAPEKPEAHNNLGFVLSKLHRNADAITEFEQAISLKPDFSDAYYNLGAALTAEHRTAEAIAAYQHGLKLNPDSESFKKRLQALGVPTN
ncbi:MAG TPA: tetratricopeptide repeat protein, partial [Verrucomicrobiae bacterium]